MLARMNRARSISFWQLTMAVGLASVSVLLFMKLFGMTQDGSFFREYIAAIVGTVTTMLTTWVLITHQAQLDESKETRTETFRRKSDELRKMLDLLLEALRDGHVDDQEAAAIFEQLHRLALLCNDKVVSETARFLRAQTVRDVAGGHGDLLKLVLLYRAELGLGDANMDADELGLIRDAIAGARAHGPRHETVRKAVTSVRSAMPRRGFGGYRWTASEADGQRSGFGFTWGLIDRDDDVVVTAEIQGHYDSEALGSPIRLAVSLNTVGLAILSDTKLARMRKGLKALGFEPDRDEDGDLMDDEFTWQVTMSADDDAEPDEPQRIARVIEQACREAVKCASNDKGDAAAKDA